MRVLAGIALSACLSIHTGAGADTLNWVGGGATDRWSDAGNWLRFYPSPPPGAFLPGPPPASGDFVHVVSSTSTSMTLDYPLMPTQIFWEGLLVGQLDLRLQAALSFPAQSVLGPAMIAFGPRQSIFVEQTGSLTVGGLYDLSNFWVTALAGSQVVMEGSSTLSSGVAYTGTTLVSAEGGGNALFRENARALGQTRMLAFGGQAPGAPGGTITMADAASAGPSTSIEVSSGFDQGLGGSLIARNFARLDGSIQNAGAYYAQVGAAGRTIFQDDAILAGVMQNFPGEAVGAESGLTEFRGRSRVSPDLLGTPLIFNFGGGQAFFDGGRTVFMDDSSAGNALILNRVVNEFNPGTTDLRGGSTRFLGQSSAGTAQIDNSGAETPGGTGGVTEFLGSSSAANARATAFGGRQSTAPGGLISFSDFSNAGASQLFTTAGENAGLPGRLVFANGATGGASVAVTNDGEFDISAVNVGLAIGSLSGAGNVNLGARQLTVGGVPFMAMAAAASAVPLPTYTVSGVISGEGGSLALAGPQRLVLAGNNTYTGPTTVSGGGALQVDGSLASAVTVQDGTVGGAGAFAGGMVVESGVLAPGGSIGVMDIGGALRMLGAADYELEIDLVALTLDLVRASEVSLVDGPGLLPTLLSNAPLPLGTALMILENTGTGAIAGTFGGLPEGALLAAGSNLFQISYQGGTGNDAFLTTVVPEPGTASLLLLALACGVPALRHRARR